MKTFVLLCFLLHLLCTSKASKPAKPKNSPKVREIDLTTESLFFHSTTLKHFSTDYSVPATQTASQVISDSFLRTGILISGLHIHPLVRFYQAHLPVDSRVLTHPLLLFLVKTIYALNDSNPLTEPQRASILDGLWREGVFFGAPQDADEAIRYLLGHYFGRRVLVMVAPLLDRNRLAWLTSVDPDLLALNHELLSSLKKFDSLPSELVERATRAHFDFSTSMNAMKTLSPEGLFSFLDARAYHVNEKQITAIATHARSFYEMIQSYPIALQAFMRPEILRRFFGNVWDAYPMALRPQIQGSTALDTDLRNALMAYYHLIETAIASFLDSVAFDGINPKQIEALKCLFEVRRQMLSDCFALNEPELVELMQMSCSYVISDALSEFYAKPPRQTYLDALAQLKIEVPCSLGEQIVAFRRILECFGIEMLPYNVNLPPSSPKQTFQTWMKALKKSSNPSYYRSAWHKKFIFYLLDEALNTSCTDDLEGDFGDQLLAELGKIPSNLISVHDLAFLEELPSKFHNLKLEHSNPITSITDLKAYDSGLEKVLQKRSSLINQLHPFESKNFRTLSKIYALIESLLTSVLTSMTFDDFYQAIQSSPLFLAAVNAVPHVLPSELICEMLFDPRGIALLKSNPRILYNLSSYWYFDCHHFVDESGFQDFDIEAVGVGLNTFSCDVLAHLFSQKEWRLEDPPALLWRLSPRILAHLQMKLLLLNNFTAQTWALQPVDAKYYDLHLKGIDIIGTLGEPTLVDLLKWHVHSELRFLEIVAYKQALIGSCAMILVADASAAILVDQFLETKLRAAADVNERSLLKRMRALLSIPLSDARASIILSVNNVRTAPESLITPFRPFHAKSSHRFHSFVKLIKQTRASSPVIAAKLKSARRECLALASEFGIDDSVFTAQIELLSILPLSFQVIGDDESGVLKLHSLMTGDLPAWQKQIVSQLVPEKKSEK